MQSEFSRHRLTSRIARAVHPGPLAEKDNPFERALAALEPRYQPIVSWRNGEVYGYQVMPPVGARSPLLGVVPTAGQARALGRVLRERIDLPPDPRARLFVKLHPTELTDPGLFDPTSRMARHADRIVLALTDRAGLDVVPDALDRVRGLRGLGFTIAIDDMGTGYGGLSCLAQLEPTVAKLDASLVRNVHLSTTKQTLVHAFGELCAELDVTLVAEGVETAAERDALIFLGCDKLQGSLFARPAAHFIGWQRGFGAG